MSGMPARRPPRLRWTVEDDAVLAAHFPAEGAAGCALRLSGRTTPAIAQRAFKLGIAGPVPPAAKRPLLKGGDVERAVAMHAAGESYAAIARAFGCCESTATNAVLAGRCRAAGFTPARRAADGSIVARDVARMRRLMMEGLRSVDIQLQMALSASTVAHHRRKYLAELKRKGGTLPPPGGGERYSGRQLSIEDRRAVEALLMEGRGAKKISEATGVSNTSVGRIRNRLIARLRRRGQCLPGCDADGVRRAQVDSARFISPETVARLREQLLAGVPVARAARMVGIGGCSAYRLRHAFAAELAAEGRALPRPVRLGNGARGRKAVAQARWMPEGKLYRYWMLCRTMTADAAKAAVIREAAEERRAEAAWPKTFAEQLARARDGAQIAAVVRIARADPVMTLGGVATGAL